jgi:hypothetical protein
VVRTRSSEMELKPYSLKKARSTIYPPSNPNNMRHASGWILQSYATLSRVRDFSREFGRFAPPAPRWFVLSCAKNAGPFNDADRRHPPQLFLETITNPPDPPPNPNVKVE